MKSVKISVNTRRRAEMLDITSEVVKAVRDSGVADGICVVFVPHTTAAVTINENADPDVRRDIEGHMARLIPEHADFRHSEGNSDGHIKTTLYGPSVTIPIDDGSLTLGTWQGIYFCEFDGPRNRSVLVKVVG